MVEALKALRITFRPGCEATDGMVACGSRSEPLAEIATGYESAVEAARTEAASDEAAA